MLPRILLLTASPRLRARLRSALEASGALLEEAADADEAWAQLGAEPFDFVIGEQDLLQAAEGAWIGQIRELPDHPEVVVLTNREDAEARAALQAAGALAVVSDSLTDPRLAQVLTTVVARRREVPLGASTAEDELSSPGLFEITSQSHAMRALLGVARKVVAADTSLLILGETGAGKEWLARAIHASGPRRGGPFVAVNCAAVPETLLESELFGHEKGAFTGAVRSRRGCFELAHGGTLFLDEIGDLPFHLGAKLLRALQERRIQRIGGERSLPVDVRIVAATHQDLEAAIEERRFRRDLYYRLSVMTLALPPLCERREDIPNLVDTYFQRFRTQLGRVDIEGLSSEALKALERYTWPGNVRELVNVVERAVLLCEGTLITLDDLPQAVAAASAPYATAGDAPALASSEGGGKDEPLSAARERLVREFETAYLTRLLIRTGGHLTETARRAGIDARTLYNKMKAYGLRKEDFKTSQRASGSAQ